MKLKDKEVQDLFKKLGECDVIAFDPKEIQEKIQTSYDMRTYAHDLLLQADILLDEVLKELSGIKKTNNANHKTKNANPKTRGVGKSVKNKKLGKKV
jgi:hypothetical protein